ncbi:SCP2 sterol-binding domain-containing protein [Streptomyces platensis]
MTSARPVRFLSEEYLTELEEQGPVDQTPIPHANVRLQFRATGMPEGPVDYYVLIEKGAVVETGRGRIESSDLTISATYNDLSAFQDGELHAATAFVTGQFAVTGDKAKLLELMVVVQAGNYHRFTADVWSRTTS